jgi:hypothetical protein
MINRGDVQLGPEQTTPVHRPRWWLEALIVLWLAWLYDVVNDLAPVHAGPGSPYAHGRSVLDLERRLRLDPETWLNRWVAVHHAVGWWAANCYDIAHTWSPSSWSASSGGTAPTCTGHCATAWSW